MKNKTIQQLKQYDNLKTFRFFGEKLHNELYNIVGYEEYLPYQNATLIQSVFLQHNTLGSYSKVNIKDLQPVLLPLSDLTKEIEHNGKKFMPIFELMKLENDRKTYKLKDAKIVTQGSQIYAECRYFDVEYPNEYSIYSIFIDKYSLLYNEYKVFQKLFEWHFDVFGLIENGLAIDMKTLT